MPVAAEITKHESEGWSPAILIACDFIRSMEESQCRQLSSSVMPEK